ncbi:MAG: hypothetical protein HOK49_15790, partial [Opitutae bacterium]|nr:hypothetical protein [Opitutae bacterium]
MKKLVATLYLVIAPILVGQTKDLLIEAESFASPGGWKLDTQFITEMG